MNLQPSHRRQDSPVRLGTHGYRLDGDSAVLEAELHIPPHCSGTDFGLELWACSAPHSGGALEGTRVASVPLNLPTPITPHVHRVEARTAANLPLGNGDHSMVLMLVSGEEARRVHDYANYGRLQHFANPSLEGAAAYSLQGERVVLRAEGVANPRAEGNVSGTLCIELWAFADPYAGGAPRGQRLAAAELGSVWGEHRLANVERSVPFASPPPGRWHLSLLLREWTLAQGYTTRDYRNFDVVYEQSAPERAAPERSAAPEAAAPEAAAPVATPVPAPPVAAVDARPAEKLRLVKPSAEPPSSAAEAAPSAAPAPAPVAIAVPPTRVDASGRLSLNGASVEQLAKLPGLSLKVAKEIVKSRPFASLDALLDVRGIGDKTLRRIKSLLTL